MLLHEATKFCPQIMDTREKLEAPMILKKVAVSFVVTLLEGVAEFIDHLEISASISRFEASVRLSGCLVGEVATRSKLPVTFEFGTQGTAGFVIEFTAAGIARLNLQPGSLLSFPVGGAVEAGNQFFTELAAMSLIVSDPNNSDANRIGELAVDWFQGRSHWEGQARGPQYEKTKFWMQFMVFAGAHFASMIPKETLGNIILGNLCVTVKEYTAFEWCISESDGDILVSCDSSDVDNVRNRELKYLDLRKALAARVEDIFAGSPSKRKLGERLSTSATNFVVMRAAKAHGLTPAKYDSIARLFSVCRCRHTANFRDPLAQHWQKTDDITYGCTGPNEGRVIWLMSKIPVVGQEHDSGIDQTNQQLNGGWWMNFGLCCIGRTPLPICKPKGTTRTGPILTSSPAPLPAYWGVLFNVRTWLLVAAAILLPTLIQSGSLIFHSGGEAY